VSGTFIKQNALMLCWHRHHGGMRIFFVAYKTVVPE